MRAISPIIALAWCATSAIFAVCASGCADSPHFRFEGQWLGHRKIDTVADANPDVKVSLSQVKLLIKPNDRFDLYYGGMPVSGNISIDGMTATLTVTNTMDRKLNKDPAALQALYPSIVLKGQKDASILFSIPKGPDPTPVQLKRIATE
jgi:hypothetical protein